MIPNSTEPLDCPQCPGAFRKHVPWNQPKPWECQRDECAAVVDRLAGMVALIEQNQRAIEDNTKALSELRTAIQELN